MKIGDGRARARWAATWPSASAPTATRSSATTCPATPPTSHPSKRSSGPRGAPGRVGHGAGRRPDRAHGRQPVRAAPAGRPRHRGGQLELARQRAARAAGVGASAASASSTPARAAACGGCTEGYCLMVGGAARARRRRAAGLRRAGPGGRVRPHRRRRHGPLHEDGPQRHRVRADAGLRRGLRAAGPLRSRHRRHEAPSAPGGRAASCARGCSISSCAPSSSGPGLEGLAPVAQDSGEGRWTVQEAVERGVPVPVITAALFARFVEPGRRRHRDEGHRGAARAVRRACGAARGRPRRGRARGRSPPTRSPRERTTVRPSDALVLFGATGDLAKKKIFPAVYDMTRLERATTSRSSASRRPSGTTTGCASTRAPPSRRRSGRRRGRVAGPRRPHHLRARRLPRPGVLRARSPAASARVPSVRSSTSPSRRSSSTTSSSASRASGSTRAPGSSSRSPSGATVRVGPRAQRDAPPRLPRGRRLPHRPLPRQGVGREPARVPLRQLAARAGLEPQLHLAACRSRWPRTSASRVAAGSTRPSARSATSCRTTCSRSWRCSRWSRRSRPTPRRLRDEKAKVFRQIRTVDAVRRRARPVPRLPRRGRRRTRHPTSRPSSALRFEIDSWRWAGVPWLIRAGKDLPGHGHRGGRRVQRPAAPAVHHPRAADAAPQPPPLPPRPQRRRDAPPPGEGAGRRACAAGRSTSRSPSTRCSASARRPTSDCSRTP